MICSDVWQLFGINTKSDILKLLYVYTYITSGTNKAIICLYYYPQRFCNFHMYIFQIELKYHCSLSQSNCRNFSCSNITIKPTSQPVLCAPPPPSPGIKYCLNIRILVVFRIVHNCQENSWRSQRHLGCRGAGVLPYKRLMGCAAGRGYVFMTAWIDHNGVAFSIELLECGRTFSEFWGKTVLRLANVPECLYCR